MRAKGVDAGCAGSATFGAAGCVACVPVADAAVGCADFAGTDDPAAGLAAGAVLLAAALAFPDLAPVLAAAGLDFAGGFFTDDEADLGWPAGFAGCSAVPVCAQAKLALNSSAKTLLLTFIAIPLLPSRSACRWRAWRWRRCCRLIRIVTEECRSGTTGHHRLGWGVWVRVLNLCVAASLGSSHLQ